MPIIATLGCSHPVFQGKLAQPAGDTAGPGPTGNIWGLCL